MARKRTLQRRPHIGAGPPAWKRCPDTAFFAARIKDEVAAIDLVDLVSLRARLLPDVHPAILGGIEVLAAPEDPTPDDMPNVWELALQDLPVDIGETVWEYLTSFYTLRRKEGPVFYEKIDALPIGFLRDLLGGLLVGFFTPLRDSLVVSKSMVAQSGIDLDDDAKEQLAEGGFGLILADSFDEAIRKVFTDWGAEACLSHLGIR